MEDKYQFLIILLALFFAWFLWSFRGESITSYFKQKGGKGIAKGIVFAFVATLVLWFLSGCTGTYFNDAHAFAGLDYANEDNGVCEGGGIDNRTTSNLGLKGSIWQSEDKMYRINAKYTHHSCAFNIDDKVYDAVGFEGEFRVW